MGLMLDASGAAVAPAPRGLVTPDGRPLGADDKFFGDVNDQLADK